MLDTPSPVQPAQTGVTQPVLTPPPPRLLPWSQHPALPGGWGVQILSAPCSLVSQPWPAQAFSPEPLPLVAAHQRAREREAGTLASYTLICQTFCSRDDRPGHLQQMVGPGGLPDSCLPYVPQLCSSQASRPCQEGLGGLKMALRPGRKTVQQTSCGSPRNPTPHPAS